MRSSACYGQLLEVLRDIDRKIRCLEACFVVISEPEMVDKVNLQLSELRRQRKGVFEQLKPLYKIK